MQAPQFAQARQEGAWRVAHPALCRCAARGSSYLRGSKNWFLATEAHSGSTMLAW